MGLLTRAAPDGARRSSGGSVRILVVTPSLGPRGGTEIAMRRLVMGLGQLPGVKVIVLTGEAPGVSAQSIRVRRVPVILKPRIARFVSFIVASSLWAIVERARAGASFDVVVGTGADCLFADVVSAHFCMATWRRLVAARAFDATAGGLRRRLRRQHDRVFFGLAEVIERRVYRQASAKVVAVSSSLAADLATSYGLEVNSIAVVPNAVDPDLLDAGLAIGRSDRRAATRAELGVDADQIVAVFVAVSEFRSKGLDLVLEAVALVDRPDLTLLVVGDEGLAYYRGLASALGIENRVVFAGRVHGVRDLLTASDLLVSGSVYETFGLTFVEAAAAGIPVVCPDVGVAAELVGHGEAGFIVSRTSDAIADGMRRLCEDATLRARLGAVAAARAVEFSPQAVATAFLPVALGTYGVSNGGPQTEG